MLWSARIELFSTVLMWSISYAGAVVPEIMPSVNQNTQSRLNLVKEYFYAGFKYFEIVLLLFCQHNITMSIRHLKRIIKANDLRRRGDVLTPIEDSKDLAQKEIQTIGKSCFLSRGYMDVVKVLQDTLVNEHRCFVLLNKKPPFSFQEETYNALYNWFTCNISKLPNIGLMDGFLKKGLKSRMFPFCYRREVLARKDQKLAIRMCARELQGICENSPLRIIKTIRLQLHDVRKLFDDLPSLKIVHLVRDPRATLSSQARLGMCSSSRGGPPGCTNLFCKRLENDVLAEERLIKMYPNRIMPVFYEDIAKHPLETSKRMYDFVGAEFTSEVENYIYNITLAGNDNNCAICTTRSNSSEHVDTWKKKMKPEFIKIVNERCNYVIKRYNFDEFPVT